MSVRSRSAPLGSGLEQASSGRRRLLRPGRRGVDRTTVPFKAIVDLDVGHIELCLLSLARLKRTIGFKCDLGAYIPPWEIAKMPQKR